MTPEFANTLVFSNIFTPAEINRCLRDLYELEIDLINPSSDIMLSAAELALKKKITIYDACYLTLAQELDIQLITADEKLYNSTKELHCLELLSNY